MFSFQLVAVALAAIFLAGQTDQQDKRPPVPRPEQIPAYMFERPVPPQGETVSLFYGDDYPPEAIAKNEQGSVGVALVIDEQGRVTQCIVTISSGFSVLDAQTCRIFVQRGKFEPARDEADKPVASAITQRITWRMTGSTPELMPTRPWSMRIEINFGENGEYHSCNVQMDGALASEGNSCSAPNTISAEVASKLVEMMGGDGAVVTLEKRLILADDQPPEVEKTGLLLTRM